MHEKVKTCFPGKREYLILRWIKRDKMYISILADTYINTFEAMSRKYQIFQFTQFTSHLFLNTFAFKTPHITKFMGPTWGQHGSCRPQLGHMLAPWTLLSGAAYMPLCHTCYITAATDTAGDIEKFCWHWFGGAHLYCKREFNPGFSGAVRCHHWLIDVLNPRQWTFVDGLCVDCSKSPITLVLTVQWVQRQQPVKGDEFWIC